MNPPYVRTALLATCLALRLGAADTPATSPATTTAPTPAIEDQRKLEEAIRLRLAEHALKKVETAAPAPAAAAQSPETAAPATTAAAPAKGAQAEPAKSADDPTMLLPRVEVSQTRITESAIQLQAKDRQIAQEKKNTKPTGLDDNLNDTEVSHGLSLFGGSSSEDRARLAEERVRLLEAERDLIEQLALARTDAERDELQKQLNDLKTMRRELERAPRDERK
jgi:hypothetical protein